MYGALISLGILIALLHAELLAKRENLDASVLWQVSFWVIIFGLIGARIFHIIQFWPYYSENLISVLFVWQGGLGIIGGFILGAVVLILALKIKRQPVLKWLDLITLNIPLAQAIGRFGNIINKELLPYAIYEMILNILLFAFLFVIKTKKKIKTGTVFLVYISGYAIIRFILEPVRNYVWEVNGISVIRVISVFVLILSLVCYSLIVRGNNDLSSSRSRRI